MGVCCASARAPAQHRSDEPLWRFKNRESFFVFPKFHFGNVPKAEHVVVIRRRRTCPPPAGGDNDAMPFRLLVPQSRADLRKLWCYAIAGWLAWHLAAFTPPDEALINSYSRAARELAGDLRALELGRFALACSLVIGGALMALSPVLVSLNHNSRLRAACWRHLGWLILLPNLYVLWLLGIGCWGVWQVYLLGPSHLLLCRAIVPWRRPGRVPQRGFPVMWGDPARKQ